MKRDGGTLYNPLTEHALWKKRKSVSALVSFDFEITARCNNNCRHCYINLPANDAGALRKELSLSRVRDIVDQAVSLGALWCRITGGEPLARPDFRDIYVYMKNKGLLVSVFTNAALITQEHVDLFKKFPPRDIEVTVYGVTQETYERVTRQRGSFKAFKRGLAMLFKAGLAVRLKTMAVRSNVRELPAITRFCRGKTCDNFRFDPFLHLRIDGNGKRNQEIKRERLTAGEIVAVEQADAQRSRMLVENCDKFIQPDPGARPHRLFVCSVGSGSCAISYDGILRPCISLWHPRCIYDLKKGSLKDGLRALIPRLRAFQSKRKDYLRKCHSCRIVNLCTWCPAHSYLETGKLDMPDEYFCDVAHARELSLRQRAKRGSR